MTFISLDVEKRFLIQQKSELEYEELVITNNYNYVTSELTTLASDESVDMESNQVQQLQYYQQLYDSQRESIESQLEVINAEVESFEKAVSNNVKKECKLSFSV